MKRLYYLTSTLSSVEEIAKDLKEKGVTDWRFHAISKNDAGLITHQIHRASVLERSDLIRFIERGVLIGLALSICLLLPIAYSGMVELATGAWIALSLFTILMCVWIGGIAGISTENYKISRFHDDIEAGKYLLLIDVKKEHLDIMKSAMEKNHPEAALQGVDSNHMNPFGERRSEFHTFRH